MKHESEKVTQNQKPNKTKPNQMNFDESSSAWMSNKLRRGAMIYYRCEAVPKLGPNKQCSNKAENVILIPGDKNRSNTDLKLCKVHRQFMRPLHLRQSTQTGNRSTEATERASGVPSTNLPAPDASSTSTATRIAAPPSRRQIPEPKTADAICAPT